MSKLKMRKSGEKDFEINTCTSSDPDKNTRKV